MTAAELRNACLAHVGSEETWPFHPRTTVFKVRGKIFALCALQAEPLRVSLKVDPALGESLRASYAAIVPGYHLNKRHWITVTVAGLDDAMVLDLVEDSYDLVVDGLPRRLRPNAATSR